MLSPANRTSFASPPRRLFSCGFVGESNFFGSKFPQRILSFSTKKIRAERSGPARGSAMGPTRASHSFDVVIIGAGIIGLSIARQFLLHSDLSVTVVDKDVPCSGSTGAGQGYLWMVHKTPGSDIWELSIRSHKLWELLAESIQEQGMNPLEVLGWKKTGSLLIGRTLKESDMLKRRVNQLVEAGLSAEYLCSSDLLLKEPAVMVEKEGGAAFLPDDCQLDARRTVAFIRKANEVFASEGRYAEFFNDPATLLLRSGNTGEIEAVQTSKNILYRKKAIIVAAGCWSGSLIHDLLRNSDVVLDVPVKPRKGHLLVLENFNFLQLKHGLMEVGYANHEVTAQHTTSSASGDQGQALSISMTATMDTMGNLVLGSSRQFSGFDTNVDEYILDHIWERARVFFPSLKELPLNDFTRSREVRVGLRPYMPDGKPLIGPVPGFSNLFLATGHEGGGLSMALGTAEMVVDMVLGNPGKVDYAPFAVQGRCV